jgi:hypothetical protein
MLIAVFGLLAGLYYSLRFGGWSMESDASSQTIAALGMVKSGQLLYSGAYNNGFAYPAQLALTSLVSGLDVRGIQLFSSLWVSVVALAAFICYREFLRSNTAAALGVLLLFLHPDFLFYIVRGSHEKYIWTFALLMLFLLMRSYRYLDKPLKLAVVVGLFYFVFWAFTASNVYFAASFMSAIVLSFLGGWTLSRLRRKRTVDQVRATTLRRLTIIALACFTLVYTFINYTYPPALQFYNIFISLFDRLGLVVLGSQEVSAPASYAISAKTWRSQEAYLMLTGWQWLIALASVVAWGIGLFKLPRLDQKRWLLWLMYSAFAFLLVYGTFADFAGFLSVNLQLRMFTPFAMFVSPLVADMIVGGLKVVQPHWMRLIVGTVIFIVICGASAALLKVTNDPVLGNQWLFYTPAELSQAKWINNNQIPPQDVWIDSWEHMAAVYYFHEGERPSKPLQYNWGWWKAAGQYTLISELARMRANRSGIQLPPTSDQNRIYDNGTVQLYHRRTLTPYQR